MYLAPATAVMAMAVGLLHGMMKYGLVNWRKAGVRSSVYLSAIQRHLDDYREGADTDEDGCDNLGAILANVAILIDSRACGQLNDDRAMPANHYRAMKVKMEAEVARLQKMHSDKAPKHYTIADGV